MFKLLETYLFRIPVLSKIEYTSITSISIACCNSFLTCPKNRKRSLTVHRYAPAPIDTRSSSTASTWAVSHQNHHEIFSKQKHSAGSPHYNTLYIMGFPLLSLQKTSMAIPTLSNGFVMLLLSMGLFRCARHRRQTSKIPCVPHFIINTDYSQVVPAVDPTDLNPGQSRAGQ